MKWKCEGQKPFRVRKSDKLILIIDNHPVKLKNNLIRHELVRIDFQEQLKYFSKFLSNFILNKNTINKMIAGLRYDLKAGKKGIYNHTFSSWRIDDNLSTVDFMEYQEKMTLYLFMVINYKKKPKDWWSDDYFKN